MFKNIIGTWKSCSFGRHVCSTRIYYYIYQCLLTMHTLRIMSWCALGLGGLLVCSERSLTIWMRIRMVTWILKKWSEPSWRSCTWYSMLGFFIVRVYKAHILHRCGLVLTVICGKAWRKGAYNEVQYSRFVEKHWTQVRGRAKANLVWSKNTGQNNISTMRCRTCSFPKPEGTAVQQTWSTLLYMHGLHVTAYKESSIYEWDFGGEFTWFAVVTKHNITLN